MTAHGFRSTASTLLNESGLSVGSGRSVSFSTTQLWEIDGAQPVTTLSRITLFPPSFALKAVPVRLIARTGETMRSEAWRPYQMRPN